MQTVSTRDIGWKVRRGLNKLGLDVVPYRHTRHPLARRLRLFDHYAIDFVLDVGANAGQYGRFLRNIGFSGPIVSFEPLSSAFEALVRAAAADGQWEARRCAVGDREGTATLNVAQNSESSSFLAMFPAHLEAYPDSQYVGTEEVSMTTLGRIVESVPEQKRVFLKIDTQGYERKVLQGAGASLARICGVQIEMSLIPLYEQEMLLPEAIGFMAQLGFTLMGIEPGASDARTGQLLQVDGIFFRR